MKEKMYDVAESVSRFLLPVFGAVYFLLSEFWFLPCAEQIMGGCLICIVVLGIVLAFRVPDGYLMIDTHDPDKDIYRLDLGENFDALSRKKEIRLKVDKDATLV